MEVRKGEHSPELPPGFRFHPTDEELIVHYLSNQAISTAYPASMIPEVDLYKFDPWQLPEKADFEESERYFFTPRDRKYPNGVRPNRATLSGYWKATGTDKAIYSSSKQVGVKKSLVFYKGKPAKGIKTNWIMHEYRLCDSHKQINKQMGSKRLDDWVLCRIYRKKQLGKVLYDHKVEEPNNPMFDIRGANDEVGKLPIESSISHPWESVYNLGSIFQFQSTSGNIAKIDDVGQSLYQLQTDHSAIGRLQVNPVANLNETMFTDPSGTTVRFGKKYARLLCEPDGESYSSNPVKTINTELVSFFFASAFLPLSLADVPVSHHQLPLIGLPPASLRPMPHSLTSPTTSDAKSRRNNCRPTSFRHRIRVSDPPPSDVAVLRWRDWKLSASSPLEPKPTPPSFHRPILDGRNAASSILLTQAETYFQ